MYERSRALLLNCIAFVSYGGVAQHECWLDSVDVVGVRGRVLACFVKNFPMNNVKEHVQHQPNTQHTHTQLTLIKKN